MVSSTVEIRLKYIYKSNQKFGGDIRQLYLFKCSTFLNRFFADLN